MQQKLERQEHDHRDDAAHHGPNFRELPDHTQRPLAGRPGQRVLNVKHRGDRDHPRQCCIQKEIARHFEAQLLFIEFPVPLRKRHGPSLGNSRAENKRGEAAFPARPAARAPLIKAK